MPRALYLLPAMFVVALSGRASAQQNAPGLPHPVLLTVFPCGVRAGVTTDVAMSGTDLDGATALHFDHAGLTAELIPQSPPQPPPPGQRRPNQPAPAPPVIFRVTAAADVPLGTHDARIVTPLGMSNPRAFVVGDKPEIVEREPNNDVPEAQRVALETTAYGVIATPTDVDYFVFGGKAGQRVLAHCQAAGVDSRLDAAMELYTPAGQRIAVARRQGDIDALLDATLPADGDYYLRLFSYTYTRGDPQHFYRLTLTAGPWLDAAFPPAVAPGATTQVTLYGRNLPGCRREPAAVRDGAPLDVLSVSVTAPGDDLSRQRLTTSQLLPPRSATLDGFEYRLSTLTGTSNPILFTFATESVVPEHEGNDTPETAQPVTLPCEIAGRIDRPGDRDWYRFAAKKGDVVSIDLLGDRLGSPCDFYLRLADDRGRELGEFDDQVTLDLLHPSYFANRSADPSRQRFVAPADGTYRVLVSARDAAVAFGPHCGYRLRLGEERPDFRLVVMPHLDNTPQTQVGPQPDALTLPQNGRQYFDVFLARTDGLNASVTVTAEGLPPGVECPPQVIHPSARQGALVLTATADAEAWAGPIRIFGTATIGGREVRREARPATVTWPFNQRNTPTIARLDRELVMSVRAAGSFRLTAGVTAISAKQGQRVTIPLRVDRDWPEVKGAVTVAPIDVPNAMATLTGGTVAAGASEATAALDLRPNAPPGVHQLVLVGKAAAFPNPNARPQPGRPANVAPHYPANPITLTILPAK